MPTQKTRNYLRYVNDGKEEDAMNQEEDAMNRVSTRGDRVCHSFP
ncbi:hypothetical protein [Nostoc sp. 'Peltigera membranacea cyanobiont' 210A]|nr:hypothetical protein [Nostoc sp. 'Peltigera membranacea cyanobiont' 210A]